MKTNDLICHYVAEIKKNRDGSTTISVGGPKAKSYTRASGGRDWYETSTGVNEDRFDNLTAQQVKNCITYTIEVARYRLTFIGRPAGTTKGYATTVASAYGMTLEEAEAELRNRFEILALRVIERQPNDQPVFGLYSQYRSYRCLNCGETQLLATNHTDECFAHCDGCSWKPSWGPKCHQIGAMPTYRPHEYVGAPPEASDYNPHASPKLITDGTPA